MRWASTESCNGPDRQWTMTTLWLTNDPVFANCWRSKCRYAFLADLVHNKSLTVAVPWMDENVSCTKTSKKPTTWTISLDDIVVHNLFKHEVVQIINSRWRSSETYQRKKVEHSQAVITKMNRHKRTKWGGPNRKKLVKWPTCCETIQTDLIQTVLTFSGPVA